MIRAEVSGNVGHDPKQHNGHTFFSVASTDKDKAGNKTTQWVDVAVFANTNLSVAGVVKGAYVTVKGHLKLEEFNGKPKLKVIAREIEVAFKAKDKTPPKRSELTYDDTSDIPF